jgi:hypothetical protein
MSGPLSTQELRHQFVDDDAESGNLRPLSDDDLKRLTLMTGQIEATWTDAAMPGVVVTHFEPRQIPEAHADEQRSLQ